MHKNFTVFILLYQQLHLIIFTFSRDLAAQVPLPVDEYSLDSSHTKTHLLLQAHFGRVPLPIADYNTDTKSVLDQAIRILQVCLMLAFNLHVLFICVLYMFG